MLKLTVSIKNIKKKKKIEYKKICEIKIIKEKLEKLYKSNKNKNLSRVVKFMFTDTNFILQNYVIFLHHLQRRKISQIEKKKKKRNLKLILLL